MHGPGSKRVDPTMPMEVIGLVGMDLQPKNTGLFQYGMKNAQVHLLVRPKDLIVTFKDLNLLFIV
jgi:hypothetical protein